MADFLYALAQLTDCNYGEVQRSVVACGIPKECSDTRVRLIAFASLADDRCRPGKRSASLINLFTCEILVVSDVRYSRENFCEVTAAWAPQRCAQYLAVLLLGTAIVLGCALL